MQLSVWCSGARIFVAWGSKPFRGSPCAGVMQSACRRPRANSYRISDYNSPQQHSNTTKEKKILECTMHSGAHPPPHTHTHARTHVYSSAARHGALTHYSHEHYNKSICATTCHKNTIKYTAQFTPAPGPGRPSPVVHVPQRRAPLMQVSANLPCVQVPLPLSSFHHLSIIAPRARHLAAPIAVVARAGAPSPRPAP